MFLPPPPSNPIHTHIPVVYATDRSNAVVPVLFLISYGFVVYTTERFMF